nr:PREDICTED: N-acetyl-beta-glucosaminyl-glycoprotein 4-beta-N-acetylgalactosaminyltransferase 1-like [Paralichthys olivaceus]
MLRFPVKKIRKQFKLLLLLVLLTSAVWFTYLHINQGKTIKLHFNYGKGSVGKPESSLHVLHRCLAVENKDSGVTVSPQPQGSISPLDGVKQ